MNHVNDDLERYSQSLRANSVKENSIRARTSYLVRLQGAYEKPLLELTVDEINGWLVSLNLGSKASLRTVKAYVKHVLKFLNGGEPSAVSRAIGPVKNSQISRVKAASDLLTREEIERLVEIGLRDRDHRAIVALLYGLGARPSEVLGMGIGDVELLKKGGKPYIQASVRDSKAGTPRTAISADPFVIRHLRAWLEVHPGGQLLFPSPAVRDRPRSESALWENLKRAATRAQIEKNVYPYLLRHVRASELFDAPPGVRDKQMGWVPGSSMWGNYEKLRPEVLVDEILKREGAAEPEAERITVGSVLEVLKERHGITISPETPENLADTLAFYFKEVTDDLLTLKAELETLTGKKVELRSMRIAKGD